MKRKKTQKLTLHIFIIVLVPLIVSYIYTNFDQAQKLETLTFSNLRTVANIQEARVENMVEQNLERLALVASRTQMRISLDEYNQTGNTEALQKVENILQDARASVSDFKVVSIANEEGEIIVSTKKSAVGMSIKDRECFTVARNTPFINTELIDGEEQLILASPLKLNDQYIGSLMIELDMETLFEITRHHIALGTTGEIIIGREIEGGDARLIIQPRFHNDQAARMIIPAEEANVPIIQALAKNETLLKEAVDYRNKEVLAVTRYIPNAHWGVVVKIDKEEAFQVIYALQITEFAMFAATIVLILIAISVYAATKD